MTLRLLPIDSRTLDLVVGLLQERSGTLPDYTRWKYSARHDTRPRGLIAMLDGQPAGCFGLVPRDLVLPSGKRLECGWFADWYVRPTVRGSGLGTQLLRCLSECYSIIFGHPGPKGAQAICDTNGYRPLDFQSRRRKILQRWRYERHRTRFLGKAVAMYGVGLLESLCERGVASRWSASSTLGASFGDTEEYGSWIMAQPVREGVRRLSGRWSEHGIEVLYIDDFFRDGLRRRRVMHTAGGRRGSTAAWDGFFGDARQHGCLYVELFTTEVEVDRVWQSHGAQLIDEPPVLVAGLSPNIKNVALHGWDRENWSVLAW